MAPTTSTGTSSDPTSLGIPALLSTHDLAYYHAGYQSSQLSPPHRAAIPPLSVTLPILTKPSPTGTHHRSFGGGLIYIVPLFIAYYSVTSNNLTYFKEAVRHCELCRPFLTTQITARDGTKCSGLWHHIINVPTHRNQMCAA